MISNWWVAWGHSKLKINGPKKPFKVAEKEERMRSPSPSQARSPSPSQTLNPMFKYQQQQDKSYVPPTHTKEPSVSGVETPDIQDGFGKMRRPMPDSPSPSEERLALPPKVTEQYKPPLRSMSEHIPMTTPVAPKLPEILPPPRRLRNASVSSTASVFDPEHLDIEGKKEREAEYRAYLQDQISARDARRAGEKGSGRMGAILEGDDDDMKRKKEQQLLYRQQLASGMGRSPSMPSIGESEIWDLDALSLDGSQRNRAVPPPRPPSSISSQNDADVQRAHRKAIEQQQEIALEILQLQRLISSLEQENDNIAKESLNNKEITFNLDQLEKDLKRLEEAQKKAVKTLDTSKMSRRARRLTQGTDEVEARLGMEVHKTLEDLEKSQKEFTAKLQSEVDAHKEVIAVESQELEAWLREASKRYTTSTSDKLVMLEHKLQDLEDIRGLDDSRVQDMARRQFASSLDSAMKEGALQSVQKQMETAGLNTLIADLDNLEKEANVNDEQLLHLQNQMHNGLEHLADNISRMAHEINNLSVFRIPPKEQEVHEWLVQCIEDTFISVHSNDAEVAAITQQATPAIPSFDVARQLQRSLWSSERMVNGLDMWDIVCHMTTPDVPGSPRLIDATQCYAVGTGLTHAPAGLPVTFTVHAILEDGMPCTTGGANIVAFSYERGTEEEQDVRPMNSFLDDSALLSMRQRERAPSPFNWPYTDNAYDNSRPATPGAMSMPDLSRTSESYRELGLPLNERQEAMLPQGEGNQVIKKSAVRNLLSFNWIRKKHKQNLDQNMVQDALNALHNLRDMQAAFWGPKRGCPLIIRDLGDGSYYVTANFPDVGMYEVNIIINGNHIHGSPFQVYVTDPMHVGSGLGPENLILSPDDTQAYIQQPDLGNGAILGAPTPQYTITTYENNALQQSVRSSSRQSVGSGQGIPSLLNPYNAAIVSNNIDNYRMQYAEQHPHIGGVDLVFLIDGTASMAGEIRTLAQQLPYICQAVQQLPLCQDLRVSVLMYKDHYPQHGSPYVVTKVDFTHDYNDVINFLDAVLPAGGGDYPEAMEYALDMCANLPWRKHSVKLAVWMGDAPPHGYEGLLQHQVEEREHNFELARQGVLQAAQKLEDYIIRYGFKRNTKVSRLEAKLERALDKADQIARFYDEHSGVGGAKPLKCRRQNT
eukprot:TRINITY_DN1376_c0_g1_i10.p1 TRINITY_DN1376_c0_g1~~TRINITY_DN1376_c0_g1_i10.p1  ORF type:complete len:1163 (-),score=150.38 TRINITY_DN1376_c0_g1_i10:52-3540(-)